LQGVNGTGIATYPKSPIDLKECGWTWEEMILVSVDINGTLYDRWIPLYRFDKKLS